MLSKNAQIGLAERQVDVMPVIIDVSLRFELNQKNHTRPYRPDFILSMVACCQQAMKELLVVNTDDLYCAVLASDFPYHSSEHTIELLRFQFPNCRTNVNFQTKTLRARILHYLEKYDIMSMIDERPIGKWAEIISPLAVNEPVLMLGSRTIPGGPRLRLYKTFGYVTKDQAMEGKIQDVEFEQVFFPQKHAHIVQKKISSMMLPAQQPIFWAAMCLSIHYNPERVVVPKDQPMAAEVGPRQQVDPEATPVSANRLVIAQESQLEIADRLLKMLGEHRKLEDHFFTDVGKALYNIDRGRAAGLDLGLSGFLGHQVVPRISVEIFIRHLTTTTAYILKLLLFMRAKTIPRPINNGMWIGIQWLSTMQPPVYILTLPKHSTGSIG